MNPINLVKILALLATIPLPPPEEANDFVNWLIYFFV